MLLRLCLLAGVLAPALLTPVLLTPAPAAAASTDDATSRAVVVMQAHVRTLHDRLHITAAQEPQWAALADAMMANARHVADLHAQGGDASSNAPADLRHYAAVAQAHAEDTKRLIAPFDALYAAMTPDQQALADRTFQRWQQERLHKAGL